MLLFCHPTGGLSVRQAALALNEAGLLGEFWTCVQYQPLGLLRRLLPERIARQLARRTFPEELAGRVRATPLREIARLFSPGAKLRQLVRRDPTPLGLAAMQRALGERASVRLASGKFSGVYAFEGGAEHLFRVARDQGLARLYDLPQGYWRAAQRLIAEEAELAPEWVPPAEQPELPDPVQQDAELALADVAFVPSSFALKTLDQSGVFNGTGVVVPFGAFWPESVPAVHPPRVSRTLRVLYAGPLDLRRGARYLFAACRRLGRSVDLTVIAPRAADLPPAMEEALSRHRWVPACPTVRLLDEMARHDVLVLPALFAGFGQPLLEAMGAGLPVITTTNTAGPDLITDGQEGFIVPIRDADAIAEKLELLLADPGRRQAMSDAAHRRAAEFSWDTYRTSLAACSALAVG